MKDYQSDPIQKKTTPSTYYDPVKPKMQSQKGKPGKYSKLCFWLALVSLTIGAMCFVIIYLFNFTFSYSTPIPYNKIIKKLVIIIVIFLSRLGGLALGIFSRINISKAIKLELHNDTEKAGSILGIFGIVINSVGILLSFLGPWQSSPIPL